MRPIEITTVTDCGRVNGFTVTLPVDGTASFNRVGDACITTTTVVGVGGVYSLPLLKPGRWVATVADCRTGCLSHFPVNIPDLCPSFIPAVPKPACVAFCGYFGAPHALPVTTVSCCPAAPPIN